MKIQLYTNNFFAQCPNYVNYIYIIILFNALTMSRNLTQSRHFILLLLEKNLSLNQHILIHASSSQLKAVAEIFYNVFKLPLSKNTSPKPMCLGLSDTIMYKCIYVYIVCLLLLYSQVLSFFKNSFSTANLVIRTIYGISALFFEMHNKNWKCQKIQYKCCYGSCMLPFGFSVIVIDMDCKFSCKKFLQRCQKMS